MNKSTIVAFIILLAVIGWFLSGNIINGNESTSDNPSNEAIIDESENNNLNNTSVTNLNQKLVTLILYYNHQHHDLRFGFQH